MLDVDNGSYALTTSTNGWLYSDRGVDALRASLTPAGVLAMWLASEDCYFFFFASAASPWTSSRRVVG